MLSTEGVVAFLATEAVLAVLILLAIWGIPKLATDGRLAQLLIWLVCIIIGAIMLIKLLRFAGIA